MACQGPADPPRWKRGRVGRGCLPVFSGATVSASDLWALASITTRLKPMMLVLSRRFSHPRKIPVPISHNTARRTAAPRTAFRPPAAAPASLVPRMARIQRLAEFVATSMRSHRSTSLVGSCFLVVTSLTKRLQVPPVQLPLGGSTPIDDVIDMLGAAAAAFALRERTSIAIAQASPLLGVVE